MATKMLSSQMEKSKSWQLNGRAQVTEPRWFRSQPQNDKNLGSLWVKTQLCSPYTGGYGLIRQWFENTPHQPPGKDRHLVGALTILTPSLALHLAHVRSMTSLEAMCSRPLEIYIHTLEMPTRAGMGVGGLFWPPMHPLETT